MTIEAIEKLLPKPTEEGCVTAGVVEALVEAGLVLRFLNESLTRSAAGKAYVAALQRLEIEKTAVKTEEEKKWLKTTAVSRAPTFRVLPPAMALGKMGYECVSLATSAALNLCDCQYRGPDPDMALSMFRKREDAVEYVRRLTAGRVEMVKDKVMWAEELEEALRELQDALKDAK